MLTAPPAERTSRLLLCRRTAETLRTGLGLLGIETVERMYRKGKRRSASPSDEAAINQ